MNPNGIWSVADSGLCLELSDKFKAEKVKMFLKQFILSDEDVDTLKRLFAKELDEGLQTDKKFTQENVSKMSMAVTYFTELFVGTETGDFLEINLTTQHLIIVLATIEPGFPVKTVRKYFTVSENIRRSPYIMMFEYLCDCLLIFFTENNLLNKPQILGFCTDLPTIRFGIDSAIISYFTPTASDFPLNCYDIQKCFETVLLKERYKEIRFTLVAIISNNMSLLIYTSYKYGPIDIFLNLENDCDMIYQEKIGRVQKWKYSAPRAKHVYIDTELGNFGRSGTLDFIATSLDWSVMTEPLSLISADKDCRLMKFLSENYILELIRHILAALHHELVYCREGDVGDLYKVNGISLSDIITFTNTTDLDHASQLLPGGTIGLLDDAIIAKYACTTVFIRAALLISICLSTILMRFQKDDFVIAIKCPLIQKYLNFKTYIKNFMEVLAPMKKFQFLTVEEDVCLEGPGLATSIVHRMKNDGQQ